MIAVIRRLTIPYKLTEWYLDLATAIPQIIGGCYLAFYFGPRHMGPFWASADGPLQPFEISHSFMLIVRNLGGIFTTYPRFFASAVGTIEIFGGLLLILGCCTRLVSFLIALVMLLTLIFRDFDGSWSSIPAFAFLGLGISGMILGSGRLGVDYLISKRFNWV